MGSEAPRKDLKNKPLVEAILEVKWALATPPPPAPPGISVDPHYVFLLGRFFERIQSTYPCHEQLPTAQMPAEMVSQMVQHRFRAAENAWPLVQLGPGIMTVNDTAGYTWPGFQKSCEDAVAALVAAHPAPKELKVDNVVLRYIDAIDFDSESENAFEFLRDKMKVNLALPPSLFDGGAESRPAAFSWVASFPLKKPDGTVTLKFATGRKPDGRPLLVWETVVISKNTQLPEFPGGFPQWLSDAHETTDDWFFKLIEGELQRRFEGD
jgi:uncharacterized protein (TIGR04255 family)